MSGCGCPAPTTSPCSTKDTVKVIKWDCGDSVDKCQLISYNGLLYMANEDVLDGDKEPPTTNVKYTKALTLNQAIEAVSKCVGCCNTSLIVDNGDGTISAINSDGSTVTWDKTDTYINIVDNGDNTVTATLTDGTTVVWDKSGLTITDNGDDTLTITRPDGSTVTWDKTDTFMTAIDNGDGTTTLVNVDGTSVTVASGYTVITNNGDGTYTGTMPDGTTQTWNGVNTDVVDNGDGTYTATLIDGSTVTWDGAVAANPTIIIDNGDGTVTATNPDGTTVTWSKDDTFTTIVDNGDGTFTGNMPDGTTITWNGAGTVAATPHANTVDNGDGTYTTTNSDGSTVTWSSVSTHAVTVDNGDGTFTTTNADSSTVTWTEGSAHNLMTQDNPPRVVLLTPNNPDLQTIPCISGHYQITGTATNFPIDLEGLITGSNALLHVYFDGGNCIYEYTDIDTGSKWLSTDKALTWKDMTCCTVIPACSGADVSEFHAEAEANQQSTMNGASDDWLSFYGADTHLGDVSFYKLDTVTEKFALSGTIVDPVQLNSVGITDGVMLEFGATQQQLLLTAGLSGGFTHQLEAFNHVAGAVTFAYGDNLGGAYNNILAATRISTIKDGAGQDHVAISASTNGFLTYEPTVGGLGVQTLTAAIDQVYRVEMFMDGGDPMVLVGTGSGAASRLSTYRKTGAVYVLEHTIPTTLESADFDVLETSGMTYIVARSSGPSTLHLYTYAGGVATPLSTVVPSGIIVHLALVETASGVKVIGSRHVNGATGINSPVSIYEADASFTSVTSFTYYGHAPGPVGSDTTPGVITAQSGDAYLAVGGADGTSPSTLNTTTYEVC